MNETLSLLSAAFSGVSMVVVAGVAIRFGEWKGRVDEKLRNIERMLDERRGDQTGPAPYSS